LRPKSRRGLLTKLKEKVQNLILLEAKAAFRVGFTPNQITGLGITLAVLSGLLYWLAGTSSAQTWLRQTFLISAPLLLLVSGFCDALDGALARLYGKATVFGGFMDSLLDRYAESAVYFGLIVGGFSDVAWGIIALVGSLLVSYARARSEAAGIKMETVGIAERAERLLIIVVGSLLNLVWSEALSWCIRLIAFLANLTVLQRAIHFQRTVSSQKPV